MKKRYCACAVSVLLLLNMGGCGLVNSLRARFFDESATLEPSGTVPKDMLSDEERVLLEKIPYYGNMRSCRLGSRMAMAYSSILSGLPDTQVASDGKRRFKLKATLYDLAEDGFPILIASYPDESVAGKLLTETPPFLYSYYDGVASLISFGGWDDLWTLELCITGDRYGFYVRMPHGTETGKPVGYQFFNVSQGKITRSYTVSEYVAVVLKDGQTAFSTELPAVGSPTPVEFRYADASAASDTASAGSPSSDAAANTLVPGFATTTKILENAGWRRSGSAYYFYRINGQDWNPDSLNFNSDSLLNDVLFSIGIQIPNATGDRLIYSRSSGMAWWLPYMDAEETENILYEFATFEKKE